jgi:HD-GYP domain-containing protein (c-di-GMP phosphodiesterase class II)
MPSTSGKEAGETRGRPLFTKVRDRLFAALLCLCLIPILVVSFVNYDAAKTAVYEQYATSIRERLRHTDEQFSLYAQLLLDSVQRLADEPAVRGTEGQLALLPRSAQTAAAEKLFRDFQRRNPSVRNVHLLADDGGRLSLFPDAHWTGGDFRRLSWYRDTLEDERGAPRLLPGAEAGADPSWLYAVQPVTNAQGRPFAVLVAEWKPDLLERWLNTDTKRHHCTLLVFASDGHLLIRVEPEPSGAGRQEESYADLGRMHNAGQTEEVRYDSRLNEMVHLFRYVSPHTGNTYVELLPAAAIDRHLGRLELILLIGTLLVVLFAAIVARQVARWIDRPISTLVEATEALQKGDFSIRVPVDGMEELSRLGNKFNQMAEQLDTLIRREREYMQKGMDQIVRSFYLAVEMKDPYTAGHSERVTRYALLIYDYWDDAKKRTISRNDLRYAGLMHDIGKVAIPDRVLLKEGKLNDEEYELIKLHTTIGADIVERIESLAHVSPGVRHHHERWDGNGYPDGLKGEDIPLLGRILAVADTFDAMTSTRSYRKAMTAEEAYAEIVRCSGTQFDPEIVRAFCRAYEAIAAAMTSPDARNDVQTTAANVT